MKINKIQEIKNFGTYTDFTWIKNCNSFKKFNFFYGWNYSGKTTLSRIFKCLEDKEKHPDYPNALFKLETDAGVITEKDIGEDFKIRVFNEDFIEENFKWDNDKHSINPVLLAGKKSMELEKEIEKLTREKEEKEKQQKEFENKKNQRERELDKFLINKASEIREILKITNDREFDKSKLKRKIEDIKDNYEKYILPDEDYQKLRSTIDNTIPYENIQKINIPLKITDFIKDVENILSKKVTAQQIIEKLKNNPDLNSWVRKGIELHKEETTCQFCGNKLPTDLFERLKKHFSDGFDELVREINDKESEIKEHINFIEKIQTPDKARFFTDYQSQYENQQETLKNELNNYIESLRVLVKNLNRKREKPFDELVCEDINDDQQSIEKIISEINEIINKHNNRVQNLEKEKEQAKKNIINHLVAISIDKIRYFSTKRLIDIYKKRIDKLNVQIKETIDEIKKHEQQIKAEAIGCKKINEYLTLFFKDDKLRLELLTEGKYKIYRDDKIAKNLSSGEKNIIALVYFFTRLEEKNFDLSQSIVFIDDPVSSLDSNHIFKVYGFLNEKLKNCGQLFITTHNFDFFNLLKDFYKYDLKNNDGMFYLIKKISKNSNKESVVENLPDVLLKFKSEYNYLFSILKNFNASSDKSNFELLYLLPNIGRRFLEAYLYMRYPDGRRFKEKAEKLFDGTNSSDKQSTLKLLDEYSHEESPEHIQKFPDINELETSIEFILNTIKDKDKEHYDALCKSI